MICCVIANYHPMVGVDFHDGFPAVIPLPIVPRAPHVVFAVVRFGPWWMANGVENENIQMPPGNAMAKVFDIGMFIPHLTFPALDSFVWMAIYTLLSSSQGHFGVASVKTPKGPIAVALMLYANPQLHCETPLPPLPTGVVLAPNTVVAGLTLGDLLAGILSMVLTSALTWGLSKAVPWLTGKLTSTIMGGLIRVVPTRIMLPATILGAALAQHFPITTAIGTQAINIAIGWAVGSPMGFSFDPAHGGFQSPFGNILTPKDDQGGSLADPIGKAFDDHVANPMGMNDYFNHSALLPPFPLGPAPVPLLVYAP